MSSREDRRERLKDIATMATGAAIGGGLGYAAQRSLYKNYGRELRRVPPDTRLKYLLPASTAVVGGVAVSKILRDKAKRRRDQVRERAKRQ